MQRTAPTIASNPTMPPPPTARGPAPLSGSKSTLKSKSKSPRADSSAGEPLPPPPVQARVQSGPGPGPGAGAGAKPQPKPRWRPGDWLEGLFGRLRDAAEALGPARGGRLLHEFADLVESSRQPEQVEAALVSLAGALSGACRVELLLDRDGPASTSPKMIAVWPEASLAMTSAQVEALGYPLCLGLWCGDHYQMTLQLYAKPGRGGRWPRRVVRKLTTLCAMAAAAERGMHASSRARLEAPVEQSAAVRDATFLNAILPYALSQAQRHRELLTVFCVEIDRLGALSQSHGSDVADLAVRRVAESIARTLRGSDVVARLDDDRMVVVLPNTGSANALTVAEMVRSAVVGACGSSGEVPELSASMGVACFPENAPEMITLLAAADEALARAREKGKNQVAMYSPPPGVVAPKAT